jgi:drug/metabolite transporter (DMT)-like permease
MALAYVAWIVVCVAWGTTYLAVHVALESFPVALLAGLRWTLAGAALAAVLPLLGQRLPPSSTWRPLALTGFLMVVVSYGAIVWAQQYVASGLTSVLVASVPFWSMVVEAFQPQGDRSTRRTLMGLSIGFFGIVVLVWPELTLRHPEGRMFVCGVMPRQESDRYPRRPGPSSAMSPTSSGSMLSERPSSLSTASGPRKPRSIESSVCGPGSLGSPQPNSCSQIATVCPPD